MTEHVTGQIMTANTSNMDGVWMVLTSLPSAEAAHALSQAVLQDRLAACVNLLPAVQSQYWWQGKLETAMEWPVWIKTTQACYADVERLIRRLHPYDTPEILAWPAITGLPAYLSWVNQEVRLPDSLL